MTERQHRAHNLVVCHDPLVAVDDGLTGAAIARSSIDQRLEYRLLRMHHVERNDVFARRGSDGSYGQWLLPQTAGKARSWFCDTT